MKRLQIALLLACAPFYGQSIPFVGCSSSGQLEEARAPKGTSKSVSIGAQDAHALGYYQSADGIGVLAPGGWYCHGNSGSGGAVLFLSPTPIVGSLSDRQGIDGAVIEVNDISGENSGRNEIAELVSRVFPAYRQLARAVWDFDSPLPVGSYPNDTLRYLSNTAVEYTTPAGTEGLGNFHSWIGKNELPIRRVAIYLPGSQDPTGEAPHLILLSVRLPRDLSWLAPTIIHYVERNPTGK